MNRVAHDERGLTFDCRCDEANRSPWRGHDFDGDVASAVYEHEGLQATSECTNCVESSSAIVLGHAASLAMLVRRTPALGRVGECAGMVQDVPNVSAKRRAKARIEGHITKHVVIDATKKEADV